MEVLISIGILAIGLSSVVALIPAGKSEAGKAVMLDRGANLAMNVLNDAVTFGLTRPASIIVSGTPMTSTLVIFDPLSITSGSFVWESGTTIAVKGTMTSEGVLASGTIPSDPLLLSLVQGRDDVLYTAPASDEDPPLNSFVNGVRSYQGRTTALVSVAAVSGTLAPGSLAKVSAVVFHNRSLSEPNDAVVSGTYNDPNKPSGTIAPATIPEGRSLKEIVRPGTVVYSPSSSPSQAWYQVAMASVDEDAGVVYVTFVNDAAPAEGLLQIAVDSIGLADRIVTLEGSGPYAQ
jgi:hypothetical protein